MQSLQGKGVLVTGASSGIGRATARAFAREGMRLALTARSADKLRALADELGGDALVLPADLAVPEEVDRLVEAAIAGLGRLDVLFANAGTYITENIIDGDPDAWDRLLAINVNSVFRAIRRVLPHMRAMGGGDIVVTGSISAHLTVPHEAIYNASKHAVTAFVYDLRRQVINDRIRVGALAPGMVLNELWGIDDPAEIERGIAERRGLRSEDVAEAAVFMLRQPGHVCIRDLIMFPQGQDI